jgi:succinate dehydrogenase / fumarate reductase, cytochrome b subunit
VNAAQAVFLCGFAVVLAAVGAFAVVVARSAARGGRAAGLGLRGGATEHSRGGRAAFLTHRLTGFGIFAFLCLHIVDVGLYSVSHRLYDDVQPIYGSAPLRVFECGLLFAILFHTGNGLRLIAVDVARLSPRWTAGLLRAVVVIATAGGVAGSALILSPLFG